MRLLLVTLAAVSLNAAAQVPTLTRVGEIGCTDCGSAAQFAMIRDVAATDSGGASSPTTELPA
jgi:hypothetical protein